MIERTEFLAKIEESIEFNPVTALVGSRQSGKTTLARQIAKKYASEGPVHYFDLESAQDLTTLDTPEQALKDLKGLIVIDEIQRKPNLFTLLRVLSDRDSLPARFLILGSASGDLLRQTSESLAGRIEYIELPGFDISEINSDLIKQLWIRGSYPKSFLAPTLQRSYRWREQFIETFLERDIGMMGVRVMPSQLRRFWQMAAHYHGQICNYTEIGRSLSITHTSIKHYMDLLTDAFMIRQLPPWFENSSKSIVKSPKFYIRDSGLLHTLLNIKTEEMLQRHPKLGASWEGFALEQVLQLSQEDRNAYFWSTYSHAEMDLIINRGSERWGFEFKYTDAPTKTKSMAIALQALELVRIYVVYPGDRSYFITDYIQAISLKDIQAIFT